MNESLPTSDPGTQKRRSTRVVQAVPITVSGVDALGQPFKERTTTVMVNCHGCKYQSKHYVPKNSVVTLEIPRMEPAFPPRIVPGHVVWVQRPRTVRELFQIGLEFEVPGNVWGIAFPPEDWIPSEDEAAATSSPTTEELDMDVVVDTEPAPSVKATTETKAPAITLPGAVQTAAEADNGGAPASMAPGEAKIHVMPSPSAPAAAAPPIDAQLAVARQMAKIVAEAKETLDKTLRRGAQTAITEEMAIVRQQLDAQMHETIEHAIKSSMERVSEAEVKKVIHQAANKTAAIVEEARVASEANVAQIDAKVRDAVQRAMVQAAEQAAVQASKETASIADEARRAIQANLQLIQEEARKVAQEAAGKAIATAEESRRSAEANVQLAEEKARRAAQEAAAQAAAINEDARRMAQQTLQQAEERAQTTAREAANQAVKQAFEQTIAADLKSRVEEVVGRAIADRESKTASNQATPLAASRNQVEDWKKTLEETAQGVRQQIAQQSQSELEASYLKWRDEFEAMLASSSAKLGERLNEASQGALANTDADIAERKASLRSFVDGLTSGAETSLRSLDSNLNQRLSNAEHAKAELQETAKATVEQTRQAFDEMIAAQQQAIKRRVSEVTSSAEASIQWLGTSLAQERASAERLKGQLEESANATVEKTRRQIDEIVAKQHETIGQRTESLIAERIERIDPILNNAAQKVIDQFWGELDQKLAPKLDDAHKAVSDITSSAQRAGELRADLDRQAEQVAKVQDSLQSRVNEISETAVQAALAKLENAQQHAERLQETIRGQVEQASGQVSLIQHAARERVQRESEATVEKAVGELAFAGQEVASLQSAIREQILRVSELAEEAAQTAREGIERGAQDVAQKIASELQSAATQAGHLRNRIHDEIQSAAAQAAEIQSSAAAQVRNEAEQVARESLERMRQEAGKFPAELESTCRVTIAKLEEELDQKSSEMQHSAYEALLKSSEWYQKKAQTNMQATMERVIEQSSNALTEKAGEVSSMVAAELDHYRRSYVDHSRSEIDEVAREVFDRERLRLNETAEIANATFTDRVQHLTHDSLKRFQEASRAGLEEAREEMKVRGGSSLESFSAKLDEKMTLGVEQAATYLQSQLMPLLEAWEAKRQAEKQEWMEQLKKSTDESIESYKARLENTTNGWLLASAATLGQNSQAVLDSLSKNAEKRMRETCSRVLANMGDVLKDRLMGISSTFGSDDAGDMK